MIKPTNHNRWIISLHLFYWVLLYTLIVIVFSSILETKHLSYFIAGFHLIGLLILVYGHLWILLPLYFDKKKYKHYLIGLLLLLLGTSVLRFFGGWGIVRYMEWGLEPNFTPTYFGSMLIGGLFFLIITIPLRLIENWFRTNELEKELTTHQLEAELRFLKAQVNPHFLFNALNNIYALSFTASKKAPEMILKLSEMMSYMLYDCKNKHVPISSEITYLNNYISLQQLKKDGEFDIEFEVDPNLSQILISPLLFIPFFENAFKHGNLDDTQNGWLKSKLYMDANHLIFTIRNTFNDPTKKAKKGGIGIENIQKRLKLLFPQHHQLKLDRKDGIYTVHLSINLQS